MGIIPRAISPQPTGRLIWYLPGGMIWWASAQVPAVPVVLPGGIIWWATSQVPAVAVVPVSPAVSAMSAVPAVTALSFGFQICAAATTVSGAIYHIQGPSFDRMLVWMPTFGRVHYTCCTQHKELRDLHLFRWFTVNPPLPHRPIQKLVSHLF